MTKISCLFLAIIFMFASCTKVEEEEFTNYRKDVKPELIIEDDFVVGGEFTSTPNRSKVVKNIRIPQNAKYWIFWVGVGQESREKYEEAINAIPKAALKITRNPIIALGLEILPSLSVLTSSRNNINCYFTDYTNSINFLNNQSYGVYYSFFNGQQTVNTYRIVRMTETPITSDGTLYMTFDNDFDWRDLDVQLKVWAFTPQ